MVDNKRTNRSTHNGRENVIDALYISVFDVHVR